MKKYRLVPKAKRTKGLKWSDEQRKTGPHNAGMSLTGPKQKIGNLKYLQKKEWGKH